MIPRNLRHLRAFLAACETRSATKAAERCRVSQPAVTFAIAKLENALGVQLFERTPGGLFPTDSGRVLHRRVKRALDRLDEALSALSSRLRLTASYTQLQALIAMREVGNYTLAARRLGVAQPTVHKAITAIEKEAGRLLFERASHGMIATRAAAALAQAARLAVAEIGQADSELAELDGREVGGIVVGAMPLARAFLLPKAIAEFRKLRPELPISLLDGPYDELIGGLRRGEIDFLIGALRSPVPVGDVEQVELFCDTLVLVSGRDHPLAGRAGITAAQLHAYPWIVPRARTPTRAQFEALFRDAGIEPPARIVESGSVIVMRGLLACSDHLGCISRAQAQAELEYGLLTALRCDWRPDPRPIGLTLRKGWVPTRLQRQFLEIVEMVTAAQKDVIRQGKS